jgi:hypothetical protein
MVTGAEAALFMPTGAETIGAGPTGAEGHLGGAGAAVADEDDGWSEPDYDNDDPDDRWGAES